MCLLIEWKDKKAKVIKNDEESKSAAAAAAAEGDEKWLQTLHL